MDKIYDQEIAHIRQIGADIDAYLNRHNANPDSPIKSWLSAALSGGQFNQCASPESKTGFTDICIKIDNLPNEYKNLIADSLCAMQSGPGKLAHYAQGRRPHQSIMPEILKCFRQAISIISNETAQDREFRRFHVLAHALCDSIQKAKFGTVWTDASKPRESVQEYNDEVIELHDILQAQFLKLDNNSLRLMNHKLKSHSPPKFAEDMAPVEMHDNPEAMETIIKANRAFNQESLDNACPYQTGHITISDIISMLDATDMEKMGELAAHLADSTNIYHEDAAPLLSFEVDKSSGEIDNIQLPETPRPTQH